MDDDLVEESWMVREGLFTPTVQVFISCKVG